MRTAASLPFFSVGHIPAASLPFFSVGHVPSLPFFSVGHVPVDHDLDWGDIGAFCYLSAFPIFFTCKGNELL